MAITVSNPILWSARILEHLNKSFVFGSALTNRNYEGEIANAGSTVRILQVGDVNVSDYTGTLPDPEGLTDRNLDLTIDQKKYFSFVVDDVEARFSVITLVDQGSQRAAIAMSDVRDQFVASFHSAVDAANNYGDDTTPITIGFGAGETKPYDALLDMGLKLDEANVPDPNRRVVLPPWFFRALEGQFGNRNTGLGDKVTSDGLSGSVDGLMIYQSNNVPNVAGAKYKVMIGQPVITFADAIVKTETYRPEKRFGTGVKGLHVYGAALVQPKALAVGTFNKGKLTQ